MPQSQETDRLKRPIVPELIQHKLLFVANEVGLWELKMSPNEPITVEFLDALKAIFDEAAEDFEILIEKTRREIKGN